MAANDGLPRGDAGRTVDLEAIDAEPNAGYVSEYDAEPATDSDQMEGLSIVTADDPRLGLTNFGGKGPDDWAADTEQSHNPPGRLTTDHMTDRSSTLTPKK